MENPAPDESQTSDPREFRRLMEQVRGGSKEAARELLERYGPHIQRVVRRKLNRRLRTRFDSLDFVQDVWASFFAAKADQLLFEGPEALIGFLVIVARNKVVEAVRDGLMSKKNNANRVRSLDGSAAIDASMLPGRQPTPSQVLVAKERWHGLLDGMTERQRQMLHLLREGRTHQEIAAELGVHLRTVRRALTKLAPKRVP